MTRTWAGTIRERRRRRRRCDREASPLAHEVSGSRVGSGMHRQGAFPRTRGPALASWPAFIVSFVGGREVDAIPARRWRRARYRRQRQWDRVPKCEPHCPGAGVYLCRRTIVCASGRSTARGK